MGLDKAGAKKAVETKRKKYGIEAFAAWGKVGGSKSKPGYFGWLKKHNPKKLAELNIKAKSSRHKALTNDK